jgi:hypothetical protein
MRYPGETATLRTLLPALALLFYALVSIWVLPQAFAGRVMVWPQKADVLAPSFVPLQFTSGNITQPLYLAVNVVFATAAALSRFARAHRLLFFNVGATDDRLRNEDCDRYTFHVEASDAMYLDALADWYIRGLAFLIDENAPQGIQILRRDPARTWFLVTADTPADRARRPTPP